MRALAISAAEWEVMELLWFRAPRPVRELVEELARRRQWRPSTSRTLLRRLVQKGAVQALSDQRPLVYQPCVTQAECARVQSRSLLQRVFGGKPVEMLVHLVEETPLSPAEIERLKQILSRKERS